MTDGPPALTAAVGEILATEAETVVESLRLGVVPPLRAAVVRAGDVVDRLEPAVGEDGAAFHRRLADAVDAVGADAVITVMRMGAEDDERSMLVVWGEEPSGAFAAVVQPFRVVDDRIALYPPSAAGPGQAGNALLDPVRDVWARRAAGGDA